MSKTGTKEWAEVNVNIQTGCRHGCLYCYAREIALRFGRISAACWWTLSHIDRKKVSQKRPKYRGTVMFPTTHDVTALNLGPCIEVLRQLLDAGNRVLIVSKPDIAVWRTVLDDLEPYKDQVTLRFSITHLEAATGRFWEPGAPSVEERIDSLRLAHGKGWRTSVSCEPLLEPWNAVALVGTVKPWVTDTIWIGAANQLRKRTAWCEEREGLAELIEGLEDWQNPVAMRRIYEALKDEPKIRWKDSYQKALGLDGPGGKETPSR